MNKPLTDDTPYPSSAIDKIIETANRAAAEHNAIAEIQELAEYWRGALERAPGSPGAVARRDAGLAVLNILERHGL